MKQAKREPGDLVSSALEHGPAAAAFNSGIGIFTYGHDPPNPAALFSSPAARGLKTRSPATLERAGLHQPGRSEVPR